MCWACFMARWISQDISRDQTVPAHGLFFLASNLTPGANSGRGRAKESSSDVLRSEDLEKTRPVHYYSLWVVHVRESSPSTIRYG